MFHIVWVMAANGLPTVKPNTNFPGSGIFENLLAVVFGLIALGMIAIFFLGLAGAANAYRTGNDSGVSRSVVGSILAAVVLGLLFIGTPFLNQWVTYLTG
ncbi:MAG: hypothetical protein ACREMY_02070 [bacterium]